MAEKVINVIVEGGKATAGPPIGPSLAPLGVNVPKVVSEINNATKGFAGLKVPVDIIVDISTKSFKIKVGAPPVSEMIKKSAGIEKGSGTKEKAGSISFNDVVEIAKGSRSKLLSKDLKGAVLEVIGTCISMGVYINDKDPREVQKEVKEGKYDSLLAG